MALAIIAIALLASLRAAGQGVANVAELRTRLLSGWIAENRLAEHRARGDWPAPGVRRGRDAAGGMGFAWREEIVATPNPAFRRIDVFVAAMPAETRTLAHFTGFVVRAPGRGR